MRQEPEHSPLQASQFEKNKHIVLVDTDIGNDIDDALALALVLRSPEIELQAVTTVFGDTQRRARLAAYLLKVFGREDVPVAAGLEKPIQPRHRPSGVHQATILDEDTGLPQLSTASGPELIVQTALAHPGRLTLLCLGPLTNVATAFTTEPHLFLAIRNIIMMGGTSGILWPERNVSSDAKAAQIVLAAGVPVTMVGLNVTMRCQLRAIDIERLRRDVSPQTQLLSKLLDIWQRYLPRWHSTLPYLHDPLTVAALCAPELLKFKQMTARVLVHGPFKGYVVPQLMNGPLVHGAVEVHVNEAREWIMQRLLSPTSSTQAS